MSLLGFRYFHVRKRRRKIFPVVIGEGGDSDGEEMWLKVDTCMREIAYG